MTTTALDLREQRANVWSQMTEIMDEATKAGRDLTAEESAKYDAAEADFDRLEASVTRMEAHAARQKEMERVDRRELAPHDVDPSGKPKAEATEAYKQAFNSWMIHGTADMERDQLATLRAGLVPMDPKEVRAAAGVGTGIAGGFTVPAEYRNAIIERMKYVASMRAVAEVITTDSGANLPWPTVDDTANIGAILGENTQTAEQDVQFGTNSLDAYMYTSKLVRVSFQLLQDSGFDFEGWLKKALGTRIARIQNMHFTTGTGVSQPDGIVTGATVGKVGAAGQVTSITFEDLVDLTETLDPAYLGAADGSIDSSLRWMLSQSLRKSIRKIKDGQGRFLWEASTQVGQPDSLLGYRTVLNNDMPVPAASAKSLLFGNFAEAYVIRDVKDFFLIRSDKYMVDYLQMAFNGFQRTDATVQNTAAYTAYQHPAA